MREATGSLTASPRRDALDIACEVINGPTDWRERAEEHRQMARAAIRVALRHGISDREIMAEYEVVRQLEEERGV